MGGRPLVRHAVIKPADAPGARMLLYSACDPSASTQVGAAPPAGTPAGMVAVRPADLARPGGGDGALVVGGAGRPVASGEPLVFCVPVVIAPAVVRRDGTVRAGGWLPDHVRLGLLEAHAGEGVIEEVVAAAEDAQPGERERLMSLELTLRLVVAMTLMPDASYVEAMARLAGHLPAVPWARPWHVPSSTVVTDWRRRLGEGPAETLFWRVAGSIDAGEGASWRGLELCAIDGFGARVPQSPANRKAFSSSGTSDDSAPFPQIRAVVATARAGRATLGAAIGPSGDGEQTLTKRMVAERPEVFGEGRVFLVDGNCLGRELIAAIRGAGAHLVMRVKAGITLELVEWLPDGSYLAWLGVRDRILVRVVEYNVEVPGRDGVSELFCLATTLLDWQAYPATAVCEAYPERWSASETTIGENKTTITDAGPSRGPILRSEEPALARQEMWAWLAGAQLVRKAACAAARAAGKPTSAGQVSFTAVRHEANRSMAQTLVTAATSPQALAAAAERAARATLARLVTTGRDRHSERRRKHQPRFPHTPTTTPTARGPATITFFGRKPPANPPSAAAPPDTAPPDTAPPDTS
jgi:Insertion element 4 transposase N-terminal/Transposase DDE domain